MTAYTITFGKVGDTYPVPPLTITEADPTEFHRAVADHAIPHLRRALQTMGRPELADCIFQSDKARAHGSFLWVDLLTGNSARFCAARITAA